MEELLEERLGGPGAGGRGGILIIGEKAVESSEQNFEELSDAFSEYSSSGSSAFLGIQKHIVWFKVNKCYALMKELYL
jgi:hypothetical protein